MIIARSQKLSPQAGLIQMKQQIDFCKKKKKMSKVELLHKIKLHSEIKVMPKIW
jgi:hypothetical protein